MVQSMDRQTYELMKDIVQQGPPLANRVSISIGTDIPVLKATLQAFL